MSPVKADPYEQANTFLNWFSQSSPWSHCFMSSCSSWYNMDLPACSHWFSAYHVHTYFIILSISFISMSTKMAFSVLSIRVHFLFRHAFAPSCDSPPLHAVSQPRNPLGPTDQSLRWWCHQLSFGTGTASEYVSTNRKGISNVIVTDRPINLIHCTSTVVMTCNSMTYSKIQINKILIFHQVLWIKRYLYCASRLFISRGIPGRSGLGKFQAIVHHLITNNSLKRKQNIENKTHKTLNFFQNSTSLNCAQGFNASLFILCMTLVMRMMCVCQRSWPLFVKVVAGGLTLEVVG